MAYAVSSTHTLDRPILQGLDVVSSTADGGAVGQDSFLRPGSILSTNVADRLEHDALCKPSQLFLSTNPLLLFCIWKHPRNQPIYHACKISIKFSCYFFS